MTGICFQIVVLTVLLDLFDFIFTLFCIQVNILLLNEFLKFMYLFTVHVYTHLVGSCDQIGVNLHFIL